MLKNFFFEYLTDQLNKKNFGHVISTTEEKYEEFSNQFNFWNIRAIAFAQLKKPKEALLSFEKAHSLDRTNPLPLFNIGKLLYEYSRFQESYSYYLKSYNLDKAYSPALLGAIHCSLKLGKYNESIDLINLGIKDHKTLEKEVLYNLLGVAYESIGSLEESCKYYQKSISENNNYYPALINEANYFAAAGNNDFAMKKYLKIIENFPNSSETHRRISIIKKYKELNDNHLFQMNELFKLNEKNEDIMEELGFALSKAYEDLKDYEKSYQFFTISNKIRNKKVIYNQEFEEKQLQFIKNIFLDKKNIQYQNNVVLEEQPIFILGMPRSGSTLVEQILSAHSKVEGLGEVDFFHQSLTKEFNLKSDFDRKNDLDFNHTISDTVKKNYLKAVASLKKNKKLFFTDKLPLNFKYIGFIVQCFPNAIIIHTERNLKDIFISIIKNYFGQLQMNYAYNEDYIIHYIDCYKNYMRFWKKLFPKNIYNIRYDLLVNNFEIELLKLLEFCNLPIEQSCYEFNKNKKSVMTASINQVRQPVYNSSEKAYINYQKFLGEYLEKISDN